MTIEEALALVRAAGFSVHTIFETQAGHWVVNLWKGDHWQPGLESRWGKGQGLSEALQEALRGESTERLGTDLNARPRLLPVQRSNEKAEDLL